MRIRVRQLVYLVVLVLLQAGCSTAKATSFPFDQEPAPSPPAPSVPGETDYDRVTFGETGLTAEEPVGWIRVEPEWLWTPAEESGLLLGVRWVDLQPPQEAESVLLPQPAQIVLSEDIDLTWGSGRLFTVEVFGPASQDNDAQAPVELVEMHAIVVVSDNGTRRAYDLYATAPDAEQMVVQEPVLRHLMDTSMLNAADEGTTRNEQLAEAISALVATFEFVQ